MPGSPSGCNLYLDQGSIVILALLVTDLTGSASITETVPSAPGFECLPLVLQAVVFPVGGGPQYQLSSGLLLVLGY